MDREELLDTLARLAERYDETGGHIGISEEEASEILRLFDEGEISGDELPLALSAATQSSRAALSVEAAAEALAASPEALSGVSTGTEGAAGATRIVPIDERRQFTVSILEDFDGEVFDDARSVIDGQLPARQWHERMLDRVRRDLLQQAQLGKGRPLSQAELEQLQDVMDEQARRLKQFADEIAARNKLAENAEQVVRRRLREQGEEATEEAVQELAEQFRARRMTTDQVAARARMYKGKGYEQFWRFSEAGIDDEEIVIDYVAVDDMATCTPCSTAEDQGPYLPGEGPMPGSVCLGGGHCRCRRERRRAPEVAVQLRGE